MPLIHKVSLYANDFLLLVSDPNNFFPVILDILNRYGAISGYKLNYIKSEPLPINPSAKALPHTIMPFKWSSSGFHNFLFIFHGYPAILQFMSLKIWNQIRKHFGLAGPSVLTSEIIISYLWGQTLHFVYGLIMASNLLMIFFFSSS